MITPPAILHSLAERANLLFFSFDLTTGHFTDFNDAFASFFGLEGNQLKPHMILAMVNPEDQQYITSQCDLDSFNLDK